MRPPFVECAAIQRLTSPERCQEYMCLKRPARSVTKMPVEVCRPTRMDDIFDRFALREARTVGAALDKTDWEDWNLMMRRAISDDARKDYYV